MQTSQRDPLPLCSSTDRKEILIPIGLQCSVPDGIKLAGARTCAFPFDWLWSPAKTTLAVLELLVRGDDGVEAAVDFMTTGHVNCRYWHNERYTIDEEATEGNFMNVATGLGVTHHAIDDAFRQKLRRRLGRLLDVIRGDEPVVLVYADAANESRNYYLDNVEYGVDATQTLRDIHALLLPINASIKVVYFCWHSRSRDVTGVVQHVPFAQKNLWPEVSDVIKDYFTAGMPG